MTKRIDPEILKKIRHIQISTRRLLNGSLVGDSRSATKGSGFEFDQIREYQMGDDIRFIDWAGSARTNSLLVRQYIEERNRTIIVALDVSASKNFSSGTTLRAEVMAQLTGLLALVADYGKDYVGLLLFSDHVEQFIPPNKGRSHVHMILEKAFTYHAQSSTTRLSAALEHIAQLPRRDALVFVVSDFIDVHDFQAPLRRAARRHDLVALRCLDSHEQQIPAIGFVPVEDLETGMMHTLDLRAGAQAQMQRYIDQRLAEQAKLFKRQGVDCVDVHLNKPFMGDIIQLFRRRMMY